MPKVYAGQEFLKSIKIVFCYKKHIDLLKEASMDFDIGMALYFFLQYFFYEDSPLITVNIGTIDIIEIYNDNVDSADNCIRYIRN